eukprot:196258_1
MVTLEIYTTLIILSVASTITCGFQYYPNDSRLEDTNTGANNALLINYIDKCEQQNDLIQNDEYDIGIGKNEFCAMSECENNCKCNRKYDPYCCNECKVAECSGFDIEKDCHSKEYYIEKDSGFDASFA